jgi:Dihaem cytochrome c
MIKHLCDASMLAGLIVLSAPVHVAGSGVEGRAALDPAYVEECGSCHVPYPAELLEGASWRALLGALGEHFDADATVDDAELKPITRYLEKNARRPAGPTAGAPLLRLTKSPWFRRMHQDINSGEWPKVKTLSNCGACHPGAQQGRYIELIKSGT